MKIISSDSHIVEPPHLWSSGVPREYKDRAPRVIEKGGVDYWFVDGIRCNSFAGGAQVGARFEDQAKLKSAASFSEVRQGAYMPDVHLNENFSDGVLGSVLYPTQGLLLFGLQDLGLLHILCQTYNDWIGEFCSYEPGRLKGVAMVPNDDVDWAVKELERCHLLGLKGAMISCAPKSVSSYEHRYYDPFWDKVVQLSMPISLHIATDRGGADFSQAGIVNADYGVRKTIISLILGGVFTRFPQLRIGIIEYELAWIPFFLERLDYSYTQRANREGWSRIDDGKLPSDIFRENIFVSFQEDPLGIRDRHTVGINNIMFGSDYPHTESTFPRSVSILQSLLQGLPTEEQNKICFENCANLYSFTDVPEFQEIWALTDKI